MKGKILYFTICILLFSCSNNSGKSDAFGNFETEPVIVSAESAGKIIGLNVEKGQKVEAGFEAALIDTVQLYLQLKQLGAQKAAVNSRKQSIQSQIDVFQEQRKNLQINEERIAKMLKDGAATQKQLDDIQGQINVIDKQISSTRTQFTAVQKELDVVGSQSALLSEQLTRCTVISPVSGTILETYAEQGELTSPGKPLFKIANLGELTLKVYVSGSQLSEVEIGEEVNVFIDKSEAENLALKGVVTWISPEAEFTPKIIQTKEERVKLVYAVKVNVKNDGTIKIGMPGEITW